MTRSRHKCSIGLNRLRVIWSFNKQRILYLIDEQGVDQSDYILLEEGLFGLLRTIRGLYGVTSG